MKTYTLKVGEVFTQKKSKELISYLKEKDKDVRQLEEALVWCSGSEDFQEGGKAREGWLKVRKLLEN